MQVAAVAVAMVEDLDHGRTAEPGTSLEPILDEIVEERVAQELKWGPQHHDPFTWLQILMEEVGEVAEEIETDFLGLRQIIVNSGRAARRYLKQVGLN